MDRDFAQKHQIPFRKIPCTVSIVVIGRRPIVSGKIFEESDLGCIVSFNIICSREHPIVVGLPWFELHNPRIDQRRREIRCSPAENIIVKDRTHDSTLKEYNSTNAPSLKHDVCPHQISTITLQKLCKVGGKEELFLFIISMTPPSATQGNSNIQIPKNDEEYADVFDKVKASVLPKHRLYDCPIDLQPGQEPPWGSIYNLSPTELEVEAHYDVPKEYCFWPKRTRVLLVLSN